MDGLFDKPLDIIQEDRDNAILDAQKGDFPITLYDRPGLAFSNLLLRGNIDAATRAIFSPQTLTPAEMKTFSDELLKGKENPLLKTITDMATNPLVIIGIIMALKYPMTGGTHNVFKVASGLAKTAPGPISSAMSSAFGNLRNVRYAFRSLARWAKATGDVLYVQGEGLNKAFHTVHKLTADDWLKISAHRQGFHKAGQVVKEGAKGVQGGTKVALQNVYKIVPKGQPIWPGLQKSMSPEALSVAQRLENWDKQFWGMITKNKAAFEEFKVSMKAKGVVVGDFIEDHFPIYAKFSQLEGPAAYNIMQSQKSFHFGIKKMTQFVAGGLKKRQGISIGQFNQLRQMERLGMPQWTDKLVAEVGKDTTRMANFIRETWNSVKGITDNDVRAKSFLETILGKMNSSKMNVRARLGNDQIARGALRKVAGKLQIESTNPERFNAAVNDIARVIMEPAQYDMRPVQAYRRYLTTAASSYTWHIGKAVHPKTNVVVQGFKNLINPIIDGTEGWQHHYLADQLVPMMRGLKPLNAMKRAVAMGEYKNKALTWLTSHELPKKLLSPNSQEWLKRYYSNFGSLSSESLGAKISEYFYVSTLGLNMSPATKNLLQNYITLLHMPGMSMAGFRGGISEMTKGIGKYTELLKTGIGKEAAFNRAFPDYIKAVGKSSGMTKAMIAGDLGKEGMGLPAVGSAWEKMKTIMLTPFSTSETFNRLFGFYVGKHSHLAAGASMAEANEFGAIVNHIAHFPGGPLGMPKALLGVWGPARQFMHFPLRYAGFLAGLPTLTQAEGLARMRPLATAAGASAGLYTVAKNMLGVDLSQGLMMGALPIPQYEKAAFHPWPLVPPMIGIGGAAAKSLHAGDTEQIGRAAALLVPGGIAARRLYKTMGKKYADYGNRLEDGRIPVYNDKNALIGAFTPWQLTLRALGISPSSQQAETGAAQWLLRQREKLRNYRRDYLEALAENDVDKATRINNDFQKAYPELGPLQLKKSDLTAVHNRREISRLNRILKGFPKDYQPLFGHMVSQASLSNMTENLERQPTALETYLPLVSSLR